MSQNDGGENDAADSLLANDFSRRAFDDYWLIGGCREANCTRNKAQTNSGRKKRAASDRTVGRSNGRDGGAIERFLAGAEQTLRVGR